MDLLSGEWRGALVDLRLATREALNHWIVTTWDSDIEHAFDRRRFYLFVDQYQRDHGFSINEAELREEIRRTAEAKGLPFGEYQEKLAHDHVSRAYDILEFLQVTHHLPI
jgi:hypothetical protein